MNRYLKWFLLTLAFYVLYNGLHFIVLLGTKELIGFEYIYIASPLAKFLVLSLIFTLYFKYNFQIKTLVKEIKWEFLIVIPILAIIFRILQDPLFNFWEILGDSELPTDFSNSEYPLKYKLSFILHFVILTPVLEELFFRGMVLEDFLKTKNGVLQVVVYSSFLFSIVHFDPSDITISLLKVIATFFFGLITGYLYQKTRNLLLPVIFHLFVNLISFFIRVYDGKYWEILNYLNFGAMYWVFVLFSGLLIFGIVIYFNKKLGKYQADGKVG